MVPDFVDPAPVGASFDPAEALASWLERSAVDPGLADRLGLFSDERGIHFPHLGSVRLHDHVRTQGHKYDHPKGASVVPVVLSDAGPASALLLAEGHGQSHALASVCDGSLPFTVAFINGCDGINAGTEPVHRDLARGRDVVVWLDADAEGNPGVRAASFRVSAHLHNAGARSVRVTHTPPTGHDSKAGADDWLSPMTATDRREAVSVLLSRVPGDLLSEVHLEELSGACGADTGMLEDLGTRAALRLGELISSGKLTEVTRGVLRRRIKERTGLGLGRIDDTAGARARDLRKEQRREAPGRPEASAGSLDLSHPSQAWENGKKVGAALFVGLGTDGSQVSTIRHWAGSFFLDRGTHYAEVEDTEVYLPVVNRVSGESYPHQDTGVPTPYPTTSKWIGELLNALAVHQQRPNSRKPEEGVFTLSGRVDPRTGQLHPRGPETFNTSSFPVEYDPAAQCPDWLSFLESSLPDPQDRAVVQEMFGYLLSGRTDLHAVFHLLGKKRGGKGTVLRVLQALMGESCQSTELPTLGETFGLQNLLGASVAVIGDARFNVRGAAEAVPRILGISGEDAVVVPRKHRKALSVRLGARLVMASNDPLTLPDTAGALASRIVTVVFSRSFAGREDRTLEARLTTPQELSGILVWSLEGYRRLDERGRFVQSDGAVAAAEERMDESEPLRPFVRDRLQPDPNGRISVEDLRQKWSDYQIKAGTLVDIKANWVGRRILNVLSDLYPDAAFRTDSRKVGDTSKRFLFGVSWL